MEFKHLVEAAEKWCSGNPFDLIFAEEDDERRLDFYAEPGVSFYHVWSESEDCLPFLQLAQDYISSCGKKTLLEVLEKVFTSFRPLLGLPDLEDDSFEHFHTDMEGEPGPDQQQMGSASSDEAQEEAYSWGRAAYEPWASTHQPKHSTTHSYPNKHTHADTYLQSTC
ncbi:hypothetical protein INR49_023728 [Caranx melampygus]|nr:hypothetical protein INR49_023728 [Caranx melampygus]